MLEPGGIEGQRKDDDERSLTAAWIDTAEFAFAANDTGTYSRVVIQWRDLMVCLHFPPVTCNAGNMSVRLPKILSNE